MSEKQSYMKEYYKNKKEYFSDRYLIKKYRHILLAGSRNDLDKNIKNLLLYNSKYKSCKTQKVIKNTTIYFD